jgi:predicted membrane channel-forming protein YqfA (hemolysin III family)
MATTHTFTRGEEIANAITHGIGAVLSMNALARYQFYYLRSNHAASLRLLYACP